MTIDQLKSRSMALRKQAETQVNTLNETVSNGAVEISMLKSADSEITETINELSSVEKQIHFKNLQNNSKNQLELMKNGLLHDNFPVLKVRDGNMEKSEPYKVLEDGTRKIDLLQLHNACGGIGANINWPDYIEKLCFLATVRAAKAVCEVNGKKLSTYLTKIENSYRMSDAARRIDFGQSIAGDAETYAAFQKAVQAMIGYDKIVPMVEYKYFLETFTSGDKKSSKVKVIKPATARTYLANVCLNILAEDFGHEIIGYPDNKKSKKPTKKKKAPEKPKLSEKRLADLRKSLASIGATCNEYGEIIMLDTKTE